MMSELGQCVSEMVAAQINLDIRRVGKFFFAHLKLKWWARKRPCPPYILYAQTGGMI